MTETNEDDMVPLHINVPRHLKDEIRVHIPKGTLSHIVRNFLKIYIAKLKKGDVDPVIGAIKALLPEEDKDAS